MTHNSVRPMCPLLLLALWSVPLPGQDVPRRPTLPDQADTNNAATYYQWGIDELDRSPGRAADAFYWAARLAPTWPDPWYAQWVARVLDNRRLLSSVVEGRAYRDQSAQRLQIDSLYLRAHLLDPFLYRGLDEKLLLQHFRRQIDRELARRNVDPWNVDPREIDLYVTQWLNSNAREDVQAWRAYQERNFIRALDLYGRVLAESPGDASAHRQRAGMFYILQDFDSARVELQAALDASRARDPGTVVPIYEATTMIEYGLAQVLDAMGDSTGARAVYSRVADGDETFYPARVQLGHHALAAGDTAAAISEMRSAVASGTTDPTPYLALGYVLHGLGQHDEAAALFRRVLELEPYWAAPHLFLGATLEELGDLAGARRQYETFLERASQPDPQRPWVEARVAALGRAIGAST